MHTSISNGWSLKFSPSGYDDFPFSIPHMQKKDGRDFHFKTQTAHANQSLANKAHSLRQFTNFKCLTYRVFTRVRAFELLPPEPRPSSREHGTGGGSSIILSWFWVPAATCSTGKADHQIHLRPADERLADGSFRTTKPAWFQGIWMWPHCPPKPPLAPWEQLVASLHARPEPVELGQWGGPLSPSGCLRQLKDGSQDRSLPACFFRGCRTAEHNPISHSNTTWRSRGRLHKHQTKGTRGPFLMACLRFTCGFLNLQTSP